MKYAVDIQNFKGRPTDKVRLVGSALDFLETEKNKNVTFWVALSAVNQALRNLPSGSPQAAKRPSRTAASAQSTATAGPANARPNA